MARLNRFWRWLRGFQSTPVAPDVPVSEPCTHVVLLDGTMSSLMRGNETNIGLTYRLLSEVAPSERVMVYYEPGIQWRGIRRATEVLAGIGINRQIKRAYLFLARNYRPGDKIFLMGYSRGAFAVRSLAGLIDKLGLMRPDVISEESMHRLYHLYECEPDGEAAVEFKDTHGQEGVTITMMGVYDTVKALGLRWPVIWRIAPVAHEFHTHELGKATLAGRHALAMDETRDAFQPLLWDVPEERDGEIVQMWFRGTHGDVGGNLGGWNAARALANISLVWMLEEAEACGLSLPPHWRSRYLTDPQAPSVGTLRGWGPYFLLRRRRKLGRDVSERIHVTARAQARKRGVPVAPDGRIG